MISAYWLKSSREEGHRPANNLPPRGKNGTLALLCVFCVGTRLSFLRLSLKKSFLFRIFSFSRCPKARLFQGGGVNFRQRGSIPLHPTKKTPPFSEILPFSPGSKLIALLFKIRPSSFGPRLVLNEKNFCERTNFSSSAGVFEGEERARTETRSLCGLRGYHDNRRLT